MVSSFKRPLASPSVASFRGGAAGARQSAELPQAAARAPTSEVGAGAPPAPARRRSVAGGRSLAYLKRLVRLRSPPGALSAAIIAAGALLSLTARAAPPHPQAEGALHGATPGAPAGGRTGGGPSEGAADGRAAPARCSTRRGTRPPPSRSHRSPSSRASSSPPDRRRCTSSTCSTASPSWRR